VDHEFYKKLNQIEQDEEQKSDSGNLVQPSKKDSDKPKRAKILYRKIRASIYN